MRTRRRNIKFLRIHFPSLALVKRNRRNAPVAPKEAHGRTGGDENFCATEQFPAEAFALIRFVRRHAAQLPGRFVFVRVQHKTRTGGRRRIFCRRIINRHMPGGRRVVAGELRRFARQTGAENSVAQVNDVFDRDTADREISRVVLGENCFHKVMGP